MKHENLSLTDIEGLLDSEDIHIGITVLYVLEPMRQLKPIAHFFFWGASVFLGRAVFLRGEKHPSTRCCSIH